MLGSFTRRRLLERVGQVAGPAAAYQAMAALELIPATANAQTFVATPAPLNGRTVAVLGAGVGGLCAAYELERAGYDVVVLEANNRLGGRSLTLRPGDSFKEMGEGSLQTCNYDPGSWLNAGPGRIPHHHTNVLHYCRTLNVALQPYVFTSRANLFHSDRLGNGGAVPLRRVVHDLHGHVAELLDKCVRSETLAQPVTGTDLLRLQKMLVEFGNLSPTEAAGGARGHAYQNAGGRAGFEVPPGLAGEPGRPLTPLSLDVLLRSDAWEIAFRDSNYAWQASLMEPVGGMDMFWRGFVRQPRTQGAGTIQDLVRLNAQVLGIETSGRGVTLAVTEGGVPRTMRVDYCISTIPIRILARMQTNLGDRYMSAAARFPIVPAGKVGWQADRFWETDYDIYGGISWDAGGLEQMWYPSEGFMSKRGVLTGAYVRGANAVAFNTKPVAERLGLARAMAERLHPGHGHKLQDGVAIAWDRMEHNRQGWSNHDDPEFQSLAQVLAQPQGRLYQAGDQLTFWAGWQEGAILSTHAAIRAISQDTKAKDAALPARG